MKPPPYDLRGEQSHTTIVGMTPSPVDILGILRVLCDTFTATAEPELLLLLAAWAGSSETTLAHSEASLAQQVLDSHFKEDKSRATFITQTILKDFLCPLFSRTPKRNSNQLISGNQRGWGDATHIGLASQQTAWKDADKKHCILVFTWAIEHSDVGNYGSPI